MVCPLLMVGWGRHHGRTWIPGVSSPYKCGFLPSASATPHELHAQWPNSHPYPCTAAVLSRTPSPALSFRATSSFDAHDVPLPSSHVSCVPVPVPPTASIPLRPQSQACHATTATLLRTHMAPPTTTLLLTSSTATINTWDSLRFKKSTTTYLRLLQVF